MKQPCFKSSLIFLSYLLYGSFPHTTHIAVSLSVQLSVLECGIWTDNHIVQKLFQSVQFKFYKIAEDFAREFFWSKGYEVLFAVHTDTAHTHVHFLVSNCNVKDGKSFRRGPAELKEMCRYFGEQCRECGLTHSYRDSYYMMRLRWSVSVIRWMYMMNS